jgi:hypothetical protein
MVSNCPHLTCPPKLIQRFLVDSIHCQPTADPADCDPVATRPLTAILTTTASDRLSWEVYAATYDLAGPVTDYLRHSHGFGLALPPFFGLDEAVATIARPGMRLSLGWDIWSGFYVFGDSPEADDLIRQLAQDLDPRLSEPEFAQFAQDW